MILIIIMKDYTLTMDIIDLQAIIIIIIIIIVLVIAMHVAIDEAILIAERISVRHWIADSGFLKGFT